MNLDDPGVYYCPKADCNGKLRETEILLYGDETTPSVECNRCNFYTTIDIFGEYLDRLRDC